MTRRARGLVYALAATLALGRQAPATTWGAREVVCPLCNAANQFRGIMSYGGYVYGWPSKFQYVFWPFTDGNVLYSCKSCRLTCFMGDFSKVPEEKKEAIRKQLEGVKFDKDYDDYAKIPMSQRLLAAEKVYTVLGEDDDFWCLFYRVTGYHFEKENKQAEAKAARKKALALAEKMLGQKENVGIRKELLVISGAMRHLLKDDKGALANFEEARKLNYENKKMKGEDSEGLDTYLGDLAKEHIGKIRNPEAKAEDKD